MKLLRSIMMATLCTAASGLTFDFEFDNTIDATVTAPLVGTGTFTFDGDVSDGTFPLNSLPNYDFDFEFDGARLFGTADIVTPIGNILVQISTVGSTRFVTFGGSGGGPFGGSIDFSDASGTLSFQPNFGSLFFVTTLDFGTFQGTLTPPSGGGGDPHFARWGRERDSFHGECDLVMVHSDGFHGGTGFDLHARTTIDSYYSYIESAAFRVGGYAVEMERDQFFIDGVQHTSKDLPMTFGDEHNYTITQLEDSEKVQLYKVNLHGHSSMSFKFYKHFLTINLSVNPKEFGDSAGLLGEFPTGDMYSRRGNLMSNFVDYGFEWQVSLDDPHLFRDDRAPQLPYERCRMPTAPRPSRRRLRQNGALLEQAKDACASQRGKNFDLCVNDVMVTEIGRASCRERV